MKHVPIELDVITQRLNRPEWVEDGFGNYLDIEKATVVQVKPKSRAKFAEVRAASERYYYLPILSARIAYGWRQQFRRRHRANTVLFETLKYALEAPDAFANFREVMEDYPAAAKDWEQFERQRRRGLVLTWCEEHNLTLILPEDFAPTKDAGDGLRRDADGEAAASAGSAEAGEAGEAGGTPPAADATDAAADHTVTPDSADNPPIAQPKPEQVSDGSDDES